MLRRPVHRGMSNRPRERFQQRITSVQPTREVWRSTAGNPTESSRHRFLRSGPGESPAIGINGSRRGSRFASEMLGSARARRRGEREDDPERSLSKLAVSEAHALLAPEKHGIQSSAGHLVAEK